ncbi:hypothetical protein ACIQZB_19050 [Streptomyces sp. NPDC097727]|uniref:hypothetical protein n=1 Tax=Streptomyces sp. NPDC097727 TaxID=3366092 RepID=UPI003801A073
MGIRIMMVAMAFALLILTAAVVLLFAMMGELSSRVPDSEDGRIVALEEYRPGAEADQWPEPLSDLVHARRSALLVLSTVCATCATVADEIGRHPELVARRPVGTVVTCASAEEGEKFAADHALPPGTYAIDAGGAWVAENFGVGKSPSALVFNGGVLTEAFAFSKVGPLLERIQIGTAREEMA